MIRVVHPDPLPDPDPDFLPIPDPGFRIQGQKGTGSRIPDPDPQYYICATILDR
jgi:hypothetical protein